MKRFSILTRLLIITLTISACGARVPQAAPTAQAIDIAGTVLAAGSTSIAQTLTAVPTATITPTATVTNTPVPSPTFIPLPATEGTVAPISGPSGNSATGDPCINKLLPPSLEGKPIKIRIDNPTKATLNVSVYLLQNGPGTQCGYRAYTLAAGQPLVINDLVEGCYTIWAWNPDPKDYFMVTNGTSCLDNSRNWTFDISPNDIKLRS